jgi:arylsulfatase A
MTVRRLILTLFLCALSAAAAGRPNILMIYADDLGWGDVGFNGRTTWTTPHLDQLAREGIRFTRWYSGAVVCAPSRGVLMTGKYTIHNGLRSNGADLPASEVTIAEALKPLGYDTSLIGKWHHGRLPDGSFTHPLDQGFDETFGFLSARHAWEHFPKELFRGRQSVPVTGYTADIFSDEAVKYIESHTERPFFLYLAYIESHFHVEAPPEEVARFRGKFDEVDPSDPRNAAYAAMITRLDKGIGRVIAALDKAGLAEKTLVVFSSDQGATFEGGNKGASAYHDSNHPFRGQKRSLEEGGIRVPSLARWPGTVPSGKVSHAVIHMSDVLPTFVAAAGGEVKPEWKVDGANVLDVFTGKADRPADRTLCWEWNSHGIQWYAAMRGNMKLLEINGAQFLYDVANDPGERRTLAQERKGVFERLRKELEEWKASEIKR